MSWDGYTSNLTQQGFTAAWILDLDGAIWAESATDKIQPAQAQTICKAFKNDSEVRASGIRVGGTKYFYLQSDDSQIQGKQGKTGISAAKASKCVVVGVYGESLNGGQARSIIEKMRDYLVGAGY